MSAKFNPDAESVSVAFPNLIRELGFRRCYRRPSAFLGISNLKCDCLRVEIPIEARAKSFGRLATGHAEMARKGRVDRSFESAEEAMPGWRKAWAKASRRSDRAIRDQLSKARRAGKVGAR